MHLRMEFDSGIGRTCNIFSSKITIYADERKTFKQSSQLVRPNYPSNCFTWDITQLVLWDGKSIENAVAKVRFTFKSLPGTTVEIKLEDKRFSPNRPLLERKFYSSALDIKVDLG